jgi:hypothetical protein
MPEGARLASAYEFIVPGEHPNLAGQARTTPVRSPIDLFDSGRGSVGAFTNVQPIAIRRLLRSGARLNAFFDDYYNRIYFLPPTVDLGAISGEVRRSVRVWNSYLRVRILDNIVIANAGGVSLNGPSLPHSFGALAISTWDVVASANGPPQIRATISFNFDTPETFALPVQGARAQISPMLPNWRDPMKISYEFSTEVMTSRNGKEQRRGLRMRPRKSIEFTSTAAGDQLVIFNRLLAHWHGRTILIPEYPRQAITSVETPEFGNTAILANDAPDWMVPGQSVMMAYAKYQEPRRIETVAGNAVVFDSVSGQLWPAGTKIHGGLSGFLEPALESRRPTNQVGEIALRLDVNPGSEIQVSPGPSPLTFNGREVFLIKPNWKSTPTQRFEIERDDVDFGRGRIARVTPWAFPAQILKLTFLDRSFEDADRIRRHFVRMGGQRGEFYMPTWEPDIRIKTTAFGTTQTLRASGTGIYDSHRDDTTTRAIAVILNTGEILLRRVEDIFIVEDDLGTDTAIQVNEPWPLDLTPEVVNKVSWLKVWRYATDTLSMEWMTNSVAQCQLTFRTLEDLS